MRSLSLLLLSAPLLFATSGCATFATNIAGDFECRAKGKSTSADCLPASRIDAAATDMLAKRDSQTHPTPRASVARGDTGRSRERTIRIVFPAHVDDTGILHEESVAWAVAEQPDWAARLRRKSDDGASGFARSVARALKAAQQRPETAELYTDDGTTETAGAQISDDPFVKASPLALPSTAREAVAGALAPAVEGFDMSAPLPHVRTPRHPGTQDAPIYPSAEAIDAARSPKEPE